MNFEFFTPTKIIFGAGTVSMLPKLARSFGSSAFIVCGRESARIVHLLQNLNAEGIRTTLFSVGTEPTVEMLSEGVTRAQQASCEVVMSIGGGSVIDAGKAIAALLANDGEILEYLEVIGKGKSISKLPAPFIAIPTTAGTGSEVTSNAVILSTEHHVKVSMRSALMYPRIAIVDPELTYSMPPSVTASTGLDALTQLIEAYVSNKSNPLTDALCVEGIKRVARSLYRSYSTGDQTARMEMSLASLFSGIALANAKLGAVHGLAAPLGGILSAPHGALCARLLPLVVEANITMLMEENPTSIILQKYSTIAQIVTNSEHAQPFDAVRWISDLGERMEIPNLRKLGLSEEIIPTIARQAMRSSSMKGNPIELNEETLCEILRRAC